MCVCTVAQKKAQKGQKVTKDAHQYLRKEEISQANSYGSKNWLGKRHLINSKKVSEKVIE
jgi:hypothetical protein